MLEARRPLSKAAKPDDFPDGERRDFLRVAVYGGIVAGAAGLGLIAQFPIAAAAAGDLTLPLLPLEALAKLEKGKPTAVEIAVARRDGWRVRTTARRVYVTRTADGNEAGAFNAFSAVCPHAGCQVGLGEGEFVCPCHNAKYNGEGAVKSGPALRGLDRLQLSIAQHEGAPWLFAAWQEFITGIEERVPRAT